MPTSNRPLIVGLVSPGLIWLAASAARGQGTPGPAGPPSNPAPASKPAGSTFSVLLMSNGSVVKGEIVHDPAGGVYRLKAKGGEVPYPRASVKWAGQSVEELYQHQVDQLPPGDPDERMKLVRWCLSQKQPELARKQLAEVMILCPADAEAKRMAFAIDANATNKSRADGAIRRTGGEMAADDAPDALDPSIVKKLRQGFGNSLPEVFDLPPAVAVKRATEFADYVQPVLQQNCASCHGDRYQGAFQLVQVKNRKDMKNPDIARSNLDAALRLVNPDDPTRSDLLSFGLVPHGPSKNPIFRGANDPQYRTLSTWVKLLRPATSPAGSPPAGATARSGFGDGVSRTGYAPESSGDGFATDRKGKSRGSEKDLSSSAAPEMDGKLAPIEAPGAVRNNFEVAESADFSAGKAADFQVLDLAAGNVPLPKSPPVGAQPPRKSPVQPATRGKPAPNAKARARSAEPDPSNDTEAIVAEMTRAALADQANSGVKQVKPGVVVIDYVDDPRELPGMGKALYPPSTRKKQGEADGETEADPTGAGTEAEAEAGDAPAPIPPGALRPPGSTAPMVPPPGATAPAATAYPVPNTLPPLPGEPKKSKAVDPALLERMMKSRKP